MFGSLGRNVLVRCSSREAPGFSEQVLLAVKGKGSRDVEFIVVRAMAAFDTAVVSFTPNGIAL